MYFIIELHVLVVDLTVIVYISGMSFTFEIDPQSLGERNIHVTLMNRMGQLGELEVGDLLIDLSSLEDQRRHTGWFTLHSHSESKGTDCSVELSLLWIYDLAMLAEQS